MGNVVSHCEEEEEELDNSPPGQTGNEPTKMHKQSPDTDQDGDDEGGDDSEGGGEEEEEEHKPEVNVATVPYDFRFPGINQARNCYTRYNEFYKCTANKSEDDPECKKHAKAYRAICPGEWVERWNEARENGSWFGKY